MLLTFKFKDNDVLYVVSINGKVRDKFNISASSTDEEVKTQAFALPRIQELTAGKEIVKVIVVKGKIVNIVIK